MEICGPLWGMTFYLMKLLRRFRRSNPWRQGGVCKPTALLPAFVAANRPIAKHAVPRPVSLRGRAAWQCVTVRACRAGCGPQPSVPSGTPMICNAGEAFSLRSILILGKCAGLGPAAICPPLSSITGLVVFDIWQAVDILLPDGICLADPGNTLGSDPHVHWKITAHNRCV